GRAHVFTAGGGLWALRRSEAAATLLDCTTGRTRTILRAVPHIYGVAPSPNGQLLAVALYGKAENPYGGFIRLWALGPNREHRVRAVAFRPDGKLLASGGCDRVVRLWDPVAHKERTALKGLGGVVLGLSFAPDGKTLAVALSDGTARLWGLDPVRERLVLAG